MLARLSYSEDEGQEYEDRGKPDMTRGRPVGTRSRPSIDIAVPPFHICAIPWRQESRPAAVKAPVSPRLTDEFRETVTLAAIDQSEGIGFTLARYEMAGKAAPDFGWASAGEIRKAEL